MGRAFPKNGLCMAHLMLAGIDLGRVWAWNEAQIWGDPDQAQQLQYLGLITVDSLKLRQIIHTR